MRTPLFPPKLRVGDTIRVIAPSQSLGIISEDVKQGAEQRLKDLGLKVTYGAHVYERDEDDSSRILSRVLDLHEAFLDPDVKAVFSVIGGYNCNQLLPYIDWELIRTHPKIFIGYSDTTALQNALLARSGLVTYSGPAFSTFGQRKYFEYTLEQFKACLFSADPVEVPIATFWSEDAWYLDQENRQLIPHEGRWVIQSGEAEGTVVGGNLGTFALLQGTPFFPHVPGMILCLEETAEADFPVIERRMESLLQVLDQTEIRGILIGRFQKASNVSRACLERFCGRHPELKGIPIIANVDFGHTSPLMTFPIGGRVQMKADLKDDTYISIQTH